MTHTITIPSDWIPPRYQLGQQAKQGFIVGLEYYPPNTRLASENGYGWRYSLLPNTYAQDMDYCTENEIQLLSSEDNRASVQALIDFHAEKLASLTELLEKIDSGGKHGKP